MCELGYLFISVPIMDFIYPSWNGTHFSQIIYIVETYFNFVAMSCFGLFEIYVILYHILSKQQQLAHSLRKKVYLCVLYHLFINTDHSTVNAGNVVIIQANQKHLNEWNVWEFKQGFYETMYGPVKSIINASLLPILFRFRNQSFSDIVYFVKKIEKYNNAHIIQLQLFHGDRYHQPAYLIYSQEI